MKEKKFDSFAVVGSLLLGVLLAVGTIAMFAGDIRARVEVLEAGKAPTREEFREFVKDTQQRLQRIEDKLDRKVGK